LLSQADYPFAYHIEHIIAEKHGGQTFAENLALSCPTCNAFKRSDIASADPLTGQATFLFHPRRQLLNDHFKLTNATIEPLTPEGRVTVFLLQFNSSQPRAEREFLIRLNRYPCPTAP
jgi:hypothetical protein